MECLQFFVNTAKSVMPILFIIIAHDHAASHLLVNLNWAASSEFGIYRLCEQRRFRRACAISPEPPLLAHTSSESRGTFRQKARSLAPLNGWACAVKICHDGMLEDTNSLGGAQLMKLGNKTDLCQTIFTLAIKAQKAF